jgi:mannosyltransferase
MIKKIFQKSQRALAMDRNDWGILAVGLAVFAAISLWTISKSSIWFDEAFGAYMIHFNFFDIARYTATDVHPPVYYWLLKLWSMFFGTTELGLRSMSVFFAGVAIVFGYLLTHRLFGRKAARTSLLFMVLAPMIVRYSQEMRMYALVTAISLAATYVLTFATQTKRRLPWVIYGILVSLGMWTHYFSAVIWIAHWAWRAYVVRESLGKKAKGFVKAFFSREWIFTHIVAVGLFLPWLPFLARQIFDVQVNGFWIPPVTPGTIPNFLTNVLYYQDQELVSSWAALLFLIITAVVILLALRIYRMLPNERRQGYVLIFAIAFVPMLLLFILSMPPLRSSFVDRYLVASTLGISLFIGTTLALSDKLLRPKLHLAVIITVAGAMLFGISNVYQLGNYNKTLHTSNNTRQTIEAITANAKSGEPIIADSPWLFYEAVFYSTDAHPVYFLDSSTDYKFGSLDMLQYNDQHKIKDLTAFTRQHPMVWYLGRPGNGGFGAPTGARNWMALQSVEVNDSVSNQPSYKAIEFQVN